MMTDLLAHFLLAIFQLFCLVLLFLFDYYLEAKVCAILQ